MVEAETILCGLMYTRNSGLLLVTIESDAAVVVKWGAIVVNTDPAINRSCKTTGFGIVIRDTTGFVMYSNSQNIISTLSPQMVEEEAILLGLMYARDSGLLLVTIESDAAVVVK
ncbi:hypothetical protein Dsin_015583 [Dipteronia sinensis]|uniref:RNase H type-1 domain-containing protein n=1 Tax=Dipteronia sinensis TaxID=43782 RepID=A0AAE0E4W7_9ROSI|nr:hypothetical protein Dsin_015583 [Dipteronia sinensis]